MEPLLVAFVGAATILLSFGGVCAIVASRRGRNPFLWYLLGSIGGPIALVFALNLPRPPSGPASSNR